MDETSISQEHIRFDDSRQIHLPMIADDDHICIIQMTTVRQCLHQLSDPEIYQIQSKRNFFSEDTIFMAGIIDIPVMYQHEFWRIFSNDITGTRDKEMIDLGVIH